MKEKCRLGDRTERGVPVNAGGVVVASVVDSLELHPQDHVAARKPPGSVRLRVVKALVHATVSGQAHTG